MLRKIVAVLSILLPNAAGLAQSPVASDPVVEVRGLAPQLVAFAGSDTNFRNLVTGLSQGVPVTLVTFTPDGFTQTVTFTPATAQSAVDIARTLESARQLLITRGVATPTAQQIGTILAGGDLPTPAGTVRVSPTLNTVTSGGLQPAPAASVGASAPRLSTTSPTSNLSVDIRPSVVPVVGTGAPTAPTTTGPNPVTTAPLPVTTGPIPVMSNPNPAFSAPNPIFTTTPAPAASTPNGAPSPAVQMQGRR